MPKDSLISEYKFYNIKYRKKHFCDTELFFTHPTIGYIKKGRAHFLYKAKTYYAYEGDLIYIAKDTKYYSVWEGNPEIEFYSIQFTFAKPYTFYEYRFQIIRNYPPEIPDMLCNTYTEKPYLSISYLYRMLDDLYTKMSIEKTAPEGIVIQPAIDYIEKNYNKRISIDTLCELCHCSESSLFKIFKKAIGITPIAYKHNIMIQNALDLLVHSDYTIEAISASVGFSSANHFRKVFFDILGKTPKEVR